MVKIMAVYFEVSAIVQFTHCNLIMITISQKFSPETQYDKA